MASPGGWHSLCAGSASWTRRWWWKKPAQCATAGLHRTHGAHRVQELGGGPGPAHDTEIGTNSLSHDADDSSLYRYYKVVDMPRRCCLDLHGRGLISCASGSEERRSKVFSLLPWPGVSPGHLRFDGGGWMARIRPAMTERSTQLIPTRAGGARS